MKPLPTEFKKGDFDHKLVKREGDVCIYWRKAPHHQEEHYEVIIVQKEKAYSRFGKDYPAAERYPSSEEWGTYGWTYNDIPAAEAKFNDAVKARLRVAESKFQPL